jgi:hypothetical protein
LPPISSEFFYYADQPDGSVTLMAVPIETEPDSRFGAAQALFTGDYVAGGEGVTTYDVTPDGDQFFMIKSVRPGESRSPPRIIVVEN